jgi:hypothetical protein
MATSEALISLVYVSEAAVPFSTEELFQLLAKARGTNKALGITGMLLFKEGNFLQALEGERDTVLALYKKIARDTRHQSVTTLSQTVITRRDFPDWSMGFHDLGASNTPKPAGYSAFLETMLTASHLSSDPGRAKKLLLLFKEEKLLAKSATPR